MVVLPNYYFPKSVNSYAPGTRSFANYSLRSDALENAYWTQGGLTSLTANAIANLYDGTSTWALVIENTANTQHYVVSTAIAITSGQNINASFFVKSGGASRIQLAVSDAGVNVLHANFNISSGTIVQAATAAGAATEASASITMCPSYAGGWYRISVSGKLNGGATSAIFALCFIDSDGASAFPTNVGTSQAIYAGGAQFERGGVALAGPYIKTTSATVSITAPVPESWEELGGNDPFAYVVDESEPALSGVLQTFTRSHARIPVPQIFPGSQWFDRPLMDDVFSGGSYAVSFDQLKSWVFTSRKTITSIGALTPGTTSKSIAARNPSGTSLPNTTTTWAEGTHSTSFAINTSASGIQSALASALTGLTNIAVTVTNTSVSVSWTGVMKYISIPSNTLKISGGATSGSITISTEDSIDAATDTDAPNQDPSVRTIACTGHGGAVGDMVAFWKGDRVVAKSKVIAVTNADNFSVIAADVDGKDLTLDYCGFAPDAAACYVAGPKMCTTRKTQTFYLPGVTSGITTYADIPTQTVYTDSQS